MENNRPRIPDFDVLRRIGGGSYGVVWIARSLTGVYRAVKVVDRARFADSRPFLRELDGITRFQHAVGSEPRQLALMHVGRDDEQGILYYVMELADDVDDSTDIDPESYAPLTLKALRERRNRLPAAECVRLGIELARALAGLHAAGLIHRDVKPSNIIFVNGVPKLADIGLVSSSDHTLTSLGTPGYAPPEGAGTMQADVYGLGKILYELATGCPTGDFPRLPAEVTTGDDAPLLLELNEVLLRACHHDVKERYPSAQALLDDLLLLQAGKSVKELVRTKHRLKLLARVTGIAALIALAAFGVLGWKYYLAAKKLAAQETAARQQAERDERLARYSADLHLAELALNSGDYGVARTALRRHSAADVRNVEWKTIWASSAGAQTITRGVAGDAPIRGLALSARGPHALSQRIDGRVELWNLETGERRALNISGRGLGGFSDDGRRFVVGTEDRRVEVFDTDTGALQRELAVRGRLVASGPNARWIVCGLGEDRGARIRVWNTELDAQAGSWFSGPGPGASERQLTAAAVSQDGRLAAAAYYDEADKGLTYAVAVWETATGKEYYRKAVPQPVWALTFDKPALRLAVARSDGIIDVWLTTDGEEQQVLALNQGRVLTVEFSPDGKFLAAGGQDGVIALVDFEQSAKPTFQRGHERGVTAVRWNSAGSELWSTSDDGTLRQWWRTDASSVPMKGDFWSGVQGDLFVAADGEHAAVTLANGELALIAMDTLATERTFPGIFQPLAWIGNEGRLLAEQVGGAIVGLDVDKREVETLVELPLPRGDLVAILASENGDAIATGWVDGRVGYWKSGEKQFQVLSGTTESPVRALAIALGSDRVIAGYRDGSVWVLDFAARTTRRVALESNVPVMSMTLLPSGREIAIGREDGRITVVDVQADQVRAELQAHAKPVACVALSPDKQRLLSGDTSGYLVTWSTDNWRPIATQTAFPGAVPGSYPGVYRIRFAKNNTRLAILSEDGRLRQWALE